jgi:bacteriocin-like protein
MKKQAKKQSTDDKKSTRRKMSKKELEKVSGGYLKPNSYPKSSM